MIRTQISLDEKEYRLAKKSAKQQGISVAEYVRRAIRQTLSQSDPKPWMKYAGMVETGDPNSSQTIDDVVYGSKK
jgi:Ribbon-helix-helix protein, copG family